MTLVKEDWILGIPPLLLPCQARGLRLGKLFLPVGIDPSMAGQSSTIGDKCSHRAHTLGYLLGFQVCRVVLQLHACTAGVDKSTHPGQPTLDMPTGSTKCNHEHSDRA